MIAAILVHTRQKCDQDDEEGNSCDKNKTNINTHVNLKKNITDICVLESTLTGTYHSI